MIISEVKKMSLPTTKRGSSQTELMPGKNAMTAAIGLAARDPELADYLVKGFIRKAEAVGGAAMLESCKDLIANLYKFRDNVVLQTQKRADPWTGQIPATTDFHNLQENIADKIATEFSSKIQGQVKVDFAISDSSQIIRGFSSEDKPISKNLEALMDQLLNSWFAENNLISKDSVIYEGSASGEILRDQAGQEMKADAEKISQLTRDSEKGLESFLKSKGIEIILQEHNYPGQKVTAETTQASKQAAEKIKIIEPETPSESPTGSAPAA